MSVGRLLLTTLNGAASGVTMRVWVWLPPQYDDPAYARTNFPVLVLYPGGDGVDYTQWFSPEKVGIVAQGAAAGQVSPFIIVEPQLQPSVSLDTECTDLEGQPKVGTFMESDVPNMIHATFRVAANRTGWGIGGASSGAYCAARLLLARPDLYSVGATLGGYFLIQTSLAAGRTPAARATSPQVIAEQHPPDVRLRLFVGEKDTVSVKENQAFLAKVRPPTVVDLRITAGGGHTWTTFQQQLPEMFAFFTANLDKALPRQ
ncbi:MAG: esterase family protein [Actinomycetota bacterium]|nr:esterase family protein [Actinomycetota bacterium]